MYMFKNVKRQCIQFFNLINDLTVYENILLPLLLTKVNKKDAHNRVMELLDNIGLAHRKDFKTNLPHERYATIQSFVSYTCDACVSPAALWFCHVKCHSRSRFIGIGWYGDQ